MLNCRLHELYLPGDKVWYFLGYLDFSTEMHLLTQELSRALRSEENQTR